MVSDMLIKGNCCLQLSCLSWPQYVACKTICHVSSLAMFMCALQHCERAPLSITQMSKWLQAKVSRLGKEARAAGHDPKGSNSRPDSAPADSEAGSGDESGSGGNEDDQANPTKAEGVSGRRTRQASVHLESAWLELEETPPKHKSKRKASCLFYGHCRYCRYQQHIADMCTSVVNRFLSLKELQACLSCVCACVHASRLSSPAADSAACICWILSPLLVPCHSPMSRAEQREGLCICKGQSRGAGKA